MGVVGKRYKGTNGKQWRGMISHARTLAIINIVREWIQWAKEEGGCVGSRARHYCERVLNQREMSENEHEIQINVGGTTMLLTSGWGVVN